MKSFDYEAVTFDGAVYCLDCAINCGMDTHNDPDVSPIFADGEWDSYPVCDICGAVQDYVNLTSDGIKYEFLQGNYKSDVVEYEFSTPSGVYTLSMVEYDRQLDTGAMRSKIACRLTRPDGYVLFSGGSFSAPTGMFWDDKAYSLMGFLTLRPGDTDDDYFAQYTDEQWFWCNGSDLSDVAELFMQVYDHEQGPPGEPEEDQ